MLDAINRAIRTENRVLNFVQNMRVYRLWSQADFVSFGSFGLDVILPEETLFLSGRRTSLGFTSAFIVTASRICCCMCA